MNNPSNAHAVDNCTQRVLALKKHVAAKTTIMINGTSMSLASVTGVYQTSLDNRAAVTTKRNEMKMAVKERIKSEAARRSTDRALKAWVGAQFGVESQEALDFGFPPTRVTPKTAEAKALAVQKGLATREARHTMGKKEKLKIKGTIVVPAVPAAPVPQTVQTAAPAVNVSTPAPVAVAPAPVQNGAPHA